LELEEGLVCEHAITVSKHANEEKNIFFNVDESKILTPFFFNSYKFSQVPKYKKCGADERIKMKKIKKRLLSVTGVFLTKN